MKCRHMTCYQCEDAELVSLREEYEIMREDNARLRKALEGLLKASAPHAQWTAAEHEARIVLEQTGKKL